MWLPSREKPKPATPRPGSGTLPLTSSVDGSSSSARVAPSSLVSTSSVRPGQSIVQLRAFGILVQRTPYQGFRLGRPVLRAAREGELEAKIERIRKSSESRRGRHSSPTDSDAKEIRPDPQPNRKDGLVGIHIRLRQTLALHPFLN